MKFFMLATFFFFHATVCMASEFKAEALELREDLSFTVEELKIGADFYDILFERYFNPSDPDGLYWKYAGNSQAFPSENATVVTYQYSDEEPLHKHNLDVYFPPYSDRGKVVMFVHGGAWRTGDKDLYYDLGQTLSKYYGYLVAVINYRLSNEEDGNAIHPMHIEDVAAAFAWVKKNIAGSRQIFIFGQSAGGHLVSLLGTDEKYLNAVGCSKSDVAGVITMSGAYDLPALVQYPDNPLGLTAQDVVMYKKIMMDAFGGWSDEYIKDPSPIYHIAPDQPPFLVIITYNDMPGFVEEGEEFVRAVKSLDPVPEIYLRRIEFSDYTDEEWSVASGLASQEESVSGYVGHYAEVVAINVEDTTSYVTKLVTDFIRSH